MGNHLYWISTLLFTLILLVTYFADYKYRNFTQKAGKAFRNLFFWIVFFCFIDFLWGICDSKIIQNKLLFFIVSELFHISIVVTTLFWLSFVLTYLEVSKPHKKFVLSFDILLIIFELVLVVLNIFRPILFTIEDGAYIPQRFRPLTFFNQYIVFLIIGTSTLARMLRRTTQNKNKARSVFCFSLAPILLGVCQLLFPECPFYSMGYFLACFIIHILLINKEKEEISRNRLISSLADIYYSMHIFDLKNHTNERLVESQMLKDLIGNITHSQTMINTVMKATVCEEYLDLVLDFVNLETVPERMKDKDHISLEFIGRNYGWTRVTLVSIERTDGLVSKLLFTTQIIDEEKKGEIQLLFQSNHDELTELYNRHAYEEDIKLLEEKPLPEDLVYVSMDLNELKTVNDTCGHAAGDEILRGAAACMKKCFGLFGKVFRIGGDEFCAILNIDDQKLEQLRSDFYDEIISWEGKLVSKLSVSCGYVLRKDLSEHATIHDIASFADKKMYIEKNNFYREKGIDRRGQKDAHVALCSLYTKILKINITNDTYQIINMDVSEKTKEMGFENQISTWLSNFGKSGQVHPDDLENYLKITNLTYISEYFSKGKKALSFQYRRKINNEFKQVIMDLIPATDYTPMNQSLFLYVRSLD